MDRATTILRQLNPNMLIGMQWGLVVAIEDITDPDGRLYRVEYRSRRDARNSGAAVLWNPWGSNPYSYVESHIRADGFLCLGTEHFDPSNAVGMDLRTTVARTRYWCTAYSVLRETGHFPNP